MAIGFLLQIRPDWWISCVVLTSMLVQFVLILVGGLRYWVSSGVLTFMVWFAYISADYVAIYALGLMLHSSVKGAGIWFSVWAPLLLVHLGGPDTINAYSMIDSELWKRHCLIMVYHIFLAVYLILVSTQPRRGEVERYRLAAAILVFIAGLGKYAERIAALRFSSSSHITSSSLPVDTFMEAHLSKKQDEYNYIVDGEQRFYKEYRNQGDKYDSTKRSLQDMGIVTIRDVEEKYGSRNSKEYILCLSHALFKIYKRRFANLLFPEENLDKTRRFFFGPPPNATAGKKSESADVFKILERELKFTYDLLFSKSSGTAFSIRGAVLRFANASMLAVASFLIYSRLQLQEEKQEAGYNGERIVTYILVSVAVVLEIFQLLRIMVSDWCMVWLICVQIRYSRCERWIEQRMAKLVNIALSVVGKLSKCSRDRYWLDRIPQYSVIKTALKSSRGLLNLRRTCLGIPLFKGKYRGTSPLLSLYMKLIVAWETKKECMDDRFKRFVHEKLEEYCNRENDTRGLPSRVFESLNEDVYSKVGLRLSTEWEREILVWHLATTICEEVKEEDDNGYHQDDVSENSVCSDYSGGKEDNDVGSSDAELREIDAEVRGKIREKIRVTGILSRYCAYLLTSCARILPLHPDMAQMEYERVFFQIIELVRKNNITTGEKVYEALKKGRECSEGPHDILDAAIDRAGELLKKEIGERWGILNKLWVALVLYYVYFYKATVHAERLAGGGEFLSQLWALLAHLGFGEIADSAVGHRGDELTKIDEEAGTATSQEEQDKKEETHEMEATVKEIPETETRATHQSDSPSTDGKEIPETETSAFKGKKTTETETSASKGKEIPETETSATHQSDSTNGMVVAVEIEEEL